MKNPLDTVSDLIFLSRDWTKAAMCAGSTVDMTPGPEGAHDYRGEEVMLAKSLCHSCVVKDVCLKDAMEDTFNPGPPGVYGELTLDERERLRISRQSIHGKHEVRSCTNCGQDCVPLVPGGTECDSCVTEEGVAKSPEMFRNNIIAMIRAGMTYSDAAKKFKLTRDAVSKACRRWGVRSKPGPRNLDASGVAELAPCGTPAAIRRHHRREEPIKDCACARPGAWSQKKTRSNGWGARAA